jgi:hypothetical protein
VRILRKARGARYRRARCHIVAIPGIRIRRAATSRGSVMTPP